MSATERSKAADVLKADVEFFSITSPWVKQTSELRMDASFYNPRVAEALATLRRSGLKLKTLGEVTDRIFIPGRFKRIYVKKEHGLPFLQGSHVVHFQPADMKFVSKTAHKDINLWVIKKGWILVTRSGTVGRVSIASGIWNGWAASEHILRIVPKAGEDCPAGYIYAFLSSEIGQAQLTSQIYGAVVDEITEDQARGVLIPVPSTPAQRKAVQEINALAMESLRAKDEAVVAAEQSVASVSTLIGQR
jgi:type I restriction enzyme S subunit